MNARVASGDCDGAKCHEEVGTIPPLRLESPTPPSPGLPADGERSPDERVCFETLLADLSASFVNVPSPDIDRRIDQSRQMIVESLGIDRSGLGEWTPDNKQLVVSHSYQRPGIPPSAYLILDEQLPWYAGMIRKGDVLRFRRLPDDLPPEAEREREYCRSIGVKSQLTIPLRVVGSVVGGIGFASFRCYRDWPDELVRHLRLIGEIFANAIARKRADEALRQLAARLLQAQEEERRRIAREMHDDWTQRLAVLSINVARLRQGAGGPDVAQALLAEVHGQLVRLSADVHSLSRQLHPSILDDLGLAEALRSECDAFAVREGIAVRYRSCGVPTGLPKDVALGLYRIAQEALRNVARHAEVAETRVDLACDGHFLTLRVEDGGVGFDPTAARVRAGIGLSSMTERALLIGAELTFLSTPGQGTVVALRVRVPGGTS